MNVRDLPQVLQDEISQYNPNHRAQWNQVLVRLPNQVHRFRMKHVFMELCMSTPKAH